MLRRAVRVSPHPPKSLDTTAQTSARARSIARSPSRARTPKPSHSASTRSAMRSGSAPGSELARLAPRRDRLGEPGAHARVEPRGGRAQLGVAHRPQPQLDPEDPVALELRPGRAGTGRSSRRACACGRARRPPPRRCARRRPARRSTRAPARAGPRGSRSGSGRASVETPASIAIRAIRTSSMPSRGDPLDGRGEDALARALGDGSVLRRSRLARPGPRGSCRRTSPRPPRAPDSGPGSQPRLSSPACTFATRSTSSSPTSSFTLRLKNWASRVRSRRVRVAVEHRGVARAPRAVGVELPDPDLIGVEVDRGVRDR